MPVNVISGTVLVPTPMSVPFTRHHEKGFYFMFLYRDHNNGQAVGFTDSQVGPGKNEIKL